MADALRVDIEKRYPSGASVTARFEFPVARAAVLVLFGPSGAGKTTVLRAIAGLERPDRGSIRFGEATWFEAASGRFVAPQQRSIGLVGQVGALFPHLTVRRNVEYGLCGWPVDGRTQRVAEMLTLLDATKLADRHPRELSGGEAQRVAIARALAPGPRLLLLDEPFTALDAPARGRLRAEVRDALKTVGISAVLVTHDRTEAIALGDEMVVLAGGVVRQIGRVADVFRRPADLVVAESVGVESVIPARIVRIDNGLVELDVGAATTLRAVDVDVDPARPDVCACIRAEDVIVQRAAATHDSARNHLTGPILGIESEGPLERVTIDCGFPLVALVTRSAREEMALAPGIIVVAAVKATSVHLVARG